MSTTTHKKINTKESVIDLTSYIDKRVRVTFIGGRQVEGKLIGADPVCNLVLD
jgi:U6 snRNA-associated Sm-like protein LSm7